MGKKKKNMLFCDYYENWIDEYKEGAIRDVTMKKYKNTLKWLKEIAPNLKMCELDRKEYQAIINKFAETHEKQTVQDFHHQLHAAILDAIDDEYLKKDPGRKTKITGKIPTPKKDKFLSQEEFTKLINDFDLENKINYDWLLLLIAKTGLRFSEAVALTPSDFDFLKHTIIVNKTWDYKNGGGFVLTKNNSSIRTVQIDEKFSKQLYNIINGLDKSKPVFLLNKDNIYNSTINDLLTKHCKNCNIPEISIHALRHTHASVLLNKGVSTASISKRLGHSNTTTTQKVYLHVIRELKNKDNAIIMQSLSEL